MAHTRLAVIDVEKGRQPMEVTAGGETYTIVYNGELYNTAELRTQLEQEGTVFQTHCDTEVLLQSYVHWGPRCVEQCNGIFAFAVWEHSARRLFLARDRIGVKPLFYAEIPNGFVFGSEIKALLQHPDVPHEIDKTGIAELLLMGPGRTAGGGVFRTIREVKPAHCGYYMQGQLHLHPYWELHAAEHTENFADTAAHVRELVTDAVRRQMISDVPIGTFLSGGLDSSLLSSLANQVMQEQGRELHTFSVDYRDNDRYFQKSHFQPTSDPTYIRAMERYLGCRHHWTVLDTPALAEALYAAVDARDLPGSCSVGRSGRKSQWLCPVNVPTNCSADTRGIGTQTFAASTGSRGHRALPTGHSFSCRKLRRRSMHRHTCRVPMPARWLPQKSCRTIPRWNPACGK